MDDVKEQREIATDLLELLRYTVTTVASGEEAVAYVAIKRELAKEIV